MRNMIIGITIGLFIGGATVIWAGPTVYRTTVRYVFSQGAQVDNAVGFYGTAPVAQGAVLTTANAGTADGTYNVGDEDVLINNNKTRISEIETRLQAYGLLP